MDGVVTAFYFFAYFYESTNSGAFFFYENRNVSNNITDEREIKILFELFEKRTEKKHHCMLTA